MSQKLVLLLGDMGIVVSVYLFVTTVILVRGSLISNFDLYQGMLPVQVILTGLLFNINGLYTIERKRFAEILLSVAVSMVQMLVLMMALTFFIREFALSRGVLLWCAGMDFVLLALWRHLLWRYVRAHQNTRGVMLIGSEEECQHVYHRMKQQPQLAMELRSVCTDLKNSDWETAAEQVDVLIICPDIRLKDKAKVVHYCNLHEKQAILIPNAYEVFCSGMTLDKIDDVPVFRPQHLLLTLEQRSLKRILDIMVALVGFFIALPFMILTAIAIKISDPGTAFQPLLMIFGAGGVLLTALVFGIIVCRIEPDNARRGPMIQAAFRGNYVLMGIPLVANIFGDAAIAIPTMMIAVIVPLYNILGVFILETFRGGRFDLLHILRGVLMNPMILGATAGALCRLVELPIPAPVLKPIAQIAAATTPVALIILGASFHGGSFHAHLRQLIFSVASRLVLVPAIVLSCAVALGFRGVELVTLIAIFATPCVVAGFAMAQQMQADAELAGNSVVYSSALSCFTIFGWVFLLKTLGFF